MTITTSTYFAPQVTVQYDQSLGIYVGQVSGPQGVSRVEGPDPMMVRMELENSVRQQYDGMVRDVDKDDKEHARGRSLGGGGGDERERDHGTIDLNEPEKDKYEERSRFLSLQLAMETISLAVPQVHFFIIGAEMAFGAMNLFKGKKKKEFKVIFDGMVIKAPTKKLLKKKLIMARNKRVQRIMGAVRISERRNVKKKAERHAKDMTKRLKRKREQAMREANDWLSRVGKSKNNKADWKDRVNTMKMRISDKRENAINLFEGR